MQTIVILVAKFPRKGYKLRLILGQNQDMYPQKIIVFWGTEMEEHTYILQSDFQCQEPYEYFWKGSIYEKFLFLPYDFNHFSNHFKN